LTTKGKNIKVERINTRAFNKTGKIGKSQLVSIQKRSKHGFGGRSGHLTKTIRGSRRATRR
jgi:hypothetical protein